MGLDMYLSERVYVSPYTNKDLYENLAEAGPQGKKPSHIDYEVGYWRKANAIHNWFVANVQASVDDCGYYYVEEHQLKELRDLCCSVITNKADPMKALPPTSGFFFGSTEIDEWYFDDLNSTVKIIDEALENKEDYSSFFYSSSW
jgi:hypothetical protein